MRWRSSSVRRTPRGTLLRHPFGDRSLYLGAERTPEHAQGALVTVHDRGAGDALEGGDLTEGEAPAEAHLDDGELLGGEYGEVEAGELLGEAGGDAATRRLGTPGR